MADSFTVSSLLYRRLLQHLPQPNNVSAPISQPTSQRRPFDSTTQFDSSMALTILVLLTALFFMGFFSVYIRRFTPADQPTPTSASPRPPPNRKGRGLDPSVVNSLPLVAYGKAAKHRMIDDCPVCLSEFQERETVKLIPFCGHVFHSNCVDTWLSAHVTCPLCRSAQLFNNADDDREGLSPCEV